MAELVDALELLVAILENQCPQGLAGSSPALCVNFLNVFLFF